MTKSHCFPLLHWCIILLFQIKPAQINFMYLEFTEFLEIEAKAKSNHNLTCMNPLPVVVAALVRKRARERCKGLFG